MIDMNKISRGTKCFSPRNNGYPGGFPIGFLDFLKKNGWWGSKRCYLCSGKVDDPDSVRVDIEPSVNPSLVEDARNTSLPADSFDCIIVDPPYTLELAKSLYNKADVWASVNSFLKEAARICKPGGLIISLSYEIPKRIPGCDFIAVWGVYQTLGVSHMRCLAVAKKLEGVN